MTPFLPRRAALRASVSTWILLYIVSVVLMKGMEYRGRLQAMAVSIPTKEDSDPSHEDGVQIPLMSGMEKQSNSPQVSSESIEEDEQIGSLSENREKSRVENAAATQVPPHSENVRSLVGDLAACDDNLARLEKDKGSKRGGKGLSVSGKQLDSCKETISTLLQWLAPQRNRSSISLCSVVSNAPVPKNGSKPKVPSEGKPGAQSPQPQIDKNNLHKQPAAMIETDSGLGKKDDERTLRCKETACDTMEDLPRLCSLPTERTKSKAFGLCDMCYPRNEELIDLYCQRPIGPDTPTLVILGGLLVTVSAAAVILIGIRHVRARSGAGTRDKNGGTRDFLISSHNIEQKQSPRCRLWGLPRIEWLKQILGRFGRRKGRSLDVEDYSMQVTGETSVDPQIPLDYVWRDGGASGRYSPQHGESGTIKYPKIRGLALAEKIPVMPRARSSSVQVPSTMATNATSTASNLTGRDGRTQRLPTVYTSSPTRFVGGPQATSAPRLDCAPP